ncbi:2088_t:CDS:2 [Funneliformis geosporum]|nr:2088_t:CDS:2 [Funneliformis geosporum]
MGANYSEAFEGANKITKRVDFHPNILRFCGITKEEIANVIHQINKYSLVLEYADCGTLNAYLNKHFNELGWDDKYRLSLQLASAVECIHDCDIVHCDLHADNILIHQKIIKLADFGLSKKIKKIAEESVNASKVFGILPYMDPKKLDDVNKGYKFNKKSDVYSIGVLMWQISSGYQPYKGLNYDESLTLSILNGKREKVINETPPEYSILYQECWKYETDERPIIHKVVSTLKAIISLEHNEIKNANLIEEEIDLSIEGKSSLKSNKERDEDLEDLELSEDMNFYNRINESNSSLQSINSFQSNISGITDFKKDSLINLTPKNKSSLKSNKAKDGGLNDSEFENENFYNNANLSNLSLKSTKSIQSYISDFKIRISSSIFQDNNSSKESVDSIFINHSTVDRLINLVIKKHNEGITFDQIKQFIKLKISQLYKIENLLNWIKKQQNSQYIWLLGLFYYYNIGINEDNVKGYELFLKAAENLTISQFYLANCYYNGYGTECDKALSFHWYQKSVENGSIIGQHYLGHCYEYGIGTQQSSKKAVYWYYKAAINGNITAKFYLAYCFRLGKGVKKDNNKAFKYYKLLAEKEITEAQYQLGNCFFTGVGTEIDKNQALFWYNKAAKNGNIISKDIIQKYYNLNIELDKAKKNKFYRLIYVEVLWLVGMNNYNRIGTKQNYEKAFYYFQKAAINNHKVAQYDFALLYYNGKGTEKNFS